MQEGKKIIQQFTIKWQFLQLSVGLVYAIAIGVSVCIITRELFLGIITFVIALGIAIIILRPWQITLDRSSAFLDRYLDTLEDSTTLLLSTPKNLSTIAQLQRHKITERLHRDIKNITPQTQLYKASIIALLIVSVSLFISRFYIIDGSSATSKIPQSEAIIFQSSDSITPSSNVPLLTKQQLTISYPRYTQLAPTTTSSMNVKILEGSKLMWQLGFKDAVKKVEIEGMFSDMEMNVSSTSFEDKFAFAKAYIPTISGYYNFKFYDTLGSTYISDMYAIEVFKDKAPEIELTGIAQFTSFEVRDKAVLKFTCKINDDYGVASATIVATVSKGSGESVKFREERLAFDQPVIKGKKVIQLSKRIVLEDLKMDRGDELYFYVETRDQKEPEANITRSETFFAVIKDTISEGFGVEGTLGADLMPDYFRSQRQLIIDTEKLLTERGKFTQETFQSRSNELGFDQKALRLKYGQFMGDEADSGVAITQEHHVDEESLEDPTKDYRHDHDSENDHNLVEEKSEHTDTHEDGENHSPLENYVHNHDDPEESTLFTASLRSKLKQAMAEMWDAELHLRLADPKNSLPYQYRALKLIQDIKNSARIYVHRIGFDPPPIKEEKRLTGDIDEVSNVFKKGDFSTEDPYEWMRESIHILEKGLTGNSELSEEDKNAFAKAGVQLAQLAVMEPSKYLKTLQHLKWLTEDKQQSKKVWRMVQKGLLKVLPPSELQTSKKASFVGNLEHLFNKELQQRD